jgi:uncharacterized protein (TIGR00369 family)
MVRAIEHAELSSSRHGDAGELVAGEVDAGEPVAGVVVMVSNATRWVVIRNPAARVVAVLNDQNRERTYSWSDPKSFADAARELSGLEFLRGIADGSLPAAPIADTLGMTLETVEEGRVIFAITPGEFHYNPIGSVHGGVFATLLDSAAACAVHSMLPAGTAYTSLDLTVKFLRGMDVGTGPVRCEGTVTHLGGRTALAQSQITDSGGKLYAHATSSCMIIRPGG